MRWAYVLLPAKDTKNFIKREDLDDLICHLGKLRILSPLNVSNINTRNSVSNLCRLNDEFRGYSCRAENVNALHF